ncbi:hypothetical protein BDF20DRAFT_812241 [Mycotypha africana]|uniref:uncharacterized protein n=1 Tax=Mycotypha africana TaxID=64632 RepID=UPI002300DFE5|nr:uncharacterized protein BDF20DRAFT_812241 [Mycotypha africana]KAI8991388.1 hypothetical protein BDF20DRAFT_812241 [Mycotypha africana]
MSEKRKRDESPEPESRPIKPIPATKIQAFTVGSQKKSAFQKHKEELEQKKQQENAEAAKVYAEFVASFEESKPYKLGISSFVKSGTLQPKNSVFDDKSSDEVSTAKSSQFKPMSFVKAGESAFGKTATTSATIPSTESAQENAPVKLNSKPQKKRNLDSFLEEIKKEQEVRSRSDIKSSESGSHDDGNPHTTNLYVGNINPTTTEIGLCQEFGKHGPIASVKIMWPRTQEEKDKGNNCGFVSFMKREDAADALEHMDGKEVDGFVIRVGWGKAVPLPDQPFFGRLSSIKK